MIAHPLKIFMSSSPYVMHCILEGLLFQRAILESEKLEITTALIAIFEKNKKDRRKTRSFSFKSAYQISLPGAGGDI
ncbi:MAG: hypothetical protein PHI98_01085 [Eubacteriales bacterium]|nr:hypothetical protein [Eubacteriales bacterium]